MPMHDDAYSIEDKVGNQILPSNLSQELEQVTIAASTSPAADEGKYAAYVRKYHERRDQAIAARLRDEEVPAADAPLLPDRLARSPFTARPSSPQSDRSSSPTLPPPKPIGKHFQCTLNLFAQQPDQWHDLCVVDELRYETTTDHPLAGKELTDDNWPFHAPMMTEFHLDVRCRKHRIHYSADPPVGDSPWTAKGFVNTVNEALGGHFHCRQGSVAAWSVAARIRLKEAVGSAEEEASGFGQIGDGAVDINEMHVSET